MRARQQTCQDRWKRRGAGDGIKVRHVDKHAKTTLLCLE